MVYAFFILTLISIGSLASVIFARRAFVEARDKASHAKAESERLLEKYKDVIDLESFRDGLGRNIYNLQAQITANESLNDSLMRQANDLKQQLKIFEEDQTVIDCGLYTPVYDFDISTKYKDALDHVRSLQKEAVKEGQAASCSQAWSLNGNAAEGKRHVDRLLRLMLRAFNGEADSFVAHVRWDNINRMIERLNTTFSAINKLDDTHTLKIEQSYLQLKIQELRLMHEFKEKQQAEKEKERRIQQQAREEEEAQRAFDLQIQKSQENESRIEVALRQAQQGLTLSQNASTIVELNQKIAALEAEKAQAAADTEDKMKMKLSRKGFVYVASNIGSFGPNTLKIGMTRRPVQDRVDELGNASVPFEFDSHGHIECEDVFKLEAELHNRLKDKCLNLVLSQKEFFAVSVDEMEAILREYNPNVELKRIPEAKSYRQTLAKRELEVSTPAQETVAPQNYQVYALENGVRTGPFSFAVINDRLKKGEIKSADALLWYQGLPEWKPISFFQTT